MIDQETQDSNDNRLPDQVIKEAAAEYLIRYLFPEFERFFGFACDALAKDCEISTEESEAILWQRLQAIVKGLKAGQAKQTHAAIFCRMFWMLDEIEIDES